MAKQIKDEQGNTYVQKKALWKKWWFWLIIVVVVIVAIPTNDETDQSSEVSKTEQAANKQEAKKKVEPAKDKQEANVGEEATYKHTTLKVDEVKWLQPNEFSDVQDGESLLAIKLTLSNKGEQRLDYSSLDFKLNCDGKSKDSDIPIDIDSDIEANKFDSGSLEKDATATGWLVFPAKQDASNIKLEWFENSVWDDKPSITINVNN